MPRTKAGTNSASKPNVAKISGEVGKPNQSVAAIREQYKIEEERQKLRYANASEDKVMRTIRDLTRNGGTSTLTTTDKEKIKRYLTGNIYANSKNLIEASKYLYYRSPIYAQIIQKYASMYCLDCRKIEPPYSFVKGLDANKAVKLMDNTLDFLDVLSIHNTVQGPLLNMWLRTCRLICSSTMNLVVFSGRLIRLRLLLIQSMRPMVVIVLEWLLI